MHRPEELRALLADHLGRLRLHDSLGALEEPVRYALEGGKRVRGVLCLATAEAAGGRAEEALHAAAALELVHAFSLVHDDLPALDDDELRRGRPSVWARYGEAVAILVGDALLAEATRAALAYERPEVARELTAATLGMIGGQYLDVTGSAPDAATLRRLKTGALFDAAIGTALAVAGVARAEQGPWRAFAGELGPLFQLVDDLIDGDGAVLTDGWEGARRLADEAALRAQRSLAEVPADTSVLSAIVGDLAERTA
jgi:geranylgeranyl diphosphate synthase, type II